MPGPSQPLQTTTAAERESQLGRTANAAQPRILQLDGLRGIAVLAVVSFHYVLSIPLPRGGFCQRLQGCFRMGGYGVDLFFVLSGFLIGGILLDSKESPRFFRTFYWRRFHRIFPLYYLWLGLYVVLGLSVFPHLPSSIRAVWPGWKPVAIYTAFLQNLIPKQLDGISAGWLGPLWSLAVEEQFYLLIPLAVRLLSRRWLAQWMVVVVVLSPSLRAIASRWSTMHAAQYVATPMRADALAMGVLLAIILRDEKWKGRIIRSMNWLYALIAALFCGVLYLALHTPTRDGRVEAVWSFSVMGLLFSAMILLALLKPDGTWAAFCRLQVLRSLGGISYCIYVIHLAVIALCQAGSQTWLGTESTIAGVVQVLLALAITWALAKLSWRYLESPMIRRGHVYKY